LYRNVFVKPGHGTAESGSLSLVTGDGSRMVARYFEAVCNSVRCKDAPFVPFCVRELTVGVCGLLNISSLKMTDLDGICKESHILNVIFLSGLPLGAHIYKRI
jgi:hypothetical protein